MRMQSKTLKLIYTFFVGILVATFVGSGIAAFYTAPKYPEMPAELKIQRAPEAEPTKVQESEELLAMQKEFDKKTVAFEEQMKIYNRNVSIIALIAAIVVLLVSLTTFKKLEVLADGLLLGGVITLLYSVMRIFESGDDKIRFLVVSAGFATALILGYIKFVKQADTRD